MTISVKIQEEREDAQIEQLIETGRKYRASDADIVNDLMAKFHLTKEEAVKCVKEYELQSV